MSEIEQLHERIKQLEAELNVTDKLLEERNQVMNEIPECESHGRQCVPHAIEWVKKAKSIMQLERPVAVSITHTAVEYVVHETGLEPGTAEELVQSVFDLCSIKVL